MQSLKPSVKKNLHYDNFLGLKNLRNANIQKKNNSGLKDLDELEQLRRGLKNLIKKDNDLNQKVVAGKAGMSSAYVSQLLSGKRDGTFEHYEKIAAACDTTVGHILVSGFKSKIHQLDPKIEELLELARQVLISDTHYAESLAMNIRSFHEAVSDRKIARTVSAVEDRSGRRKGAQIREKDPPDQAGALIRKRAV